MKIKSILNESLTGLCIFINAIGIVLMGYKVIVLASSILNSLQAVAISTDLRSYFH